MADVLALRIVDVERDLFFRPGLRLQEVVNDGALGWVVADGTLAIDLIGKVEASCSRGLVKVEVVVGNVVVACLAKRAYVVEDPERAAMCRGNEITIFDSQIMHWRRWQVQLQWLPMSTVVKGEVHARFCACVE